VLLEAVLAEHVNDLAAAADRWAARAAPGDAFFGFLFEVIEKSADRRGVCDALTMDKGRPRASLAAAAGRFHEALGRLLAKAKRAARLGQDEARARDRASDRLSGGLPGRDQRGDGARPRRS
jgi:Transcriptional regulator SbtR-like, C-terminal domain